MSANLCLPKERNEPFLGNGGTGIEPALSPSRPLAGALFLERSSALSRSNGELGELGVGLAVTTGIR